MKALIAVASRHGSTREIGDALAAELRTLGHTADVLEISDDLQFAGYDAVVVGSAVYMGQWLSSAKHFVERNAQELAKVPVWLFSSGPIGTREPEAKDAPLHIDRLIEKVAARGHRVFVGKLDRHQLGLGERFIIWNVNRLAAGGVPDGDFRNWTAIRAWADEIAEATSLVPG